MRLNFPASTTADISDRIARLAGVSRPELYFRPVNSQAFRANTYQAAVAGTYGVMEAAHVSTDAGSTLITSIQCSPGGTSAIELGIQTTRASGLTTLTPQSLSPGTGTATLSLNGGTVSAAPEVPRLQGFAASDHFNEMLAPHAILLPRGYLLRVKNNTANQIFIANMSWIQF